MKTLIISLLATTSLMSFDLPTVAVVSLLPDQTSEMASPSYPAPLAAKTLDAARNAIEALPVFAWTETTFDFGTIKQNTPVTHEFRFTNKGVEPLIITSVQASCGCTVTKYSKDPIAPGSDGFVTATYNAATKGVFNKTVTVNANTTDGVVVLSIHGEVE